MPLQDTFTSGTLDTLVIGAGQAGLATGYHLRNAGLRFVILEADDALGGSWKHYYRSLRLFSPARYSALPGQPFPGDPGHYPTRDATIAYLHSYAHTQRLPVITGCRVREVTRRGDGVFEVHAAGRMFRARSLVVASGSFHDPRMPTLPGQEGFTGTVLHSIGYRSPEAFAGQRVLVVGAANSGVQIAAELATVARVSIAARRPPSFVPQRILGADVHAWWSVFGLDSAEPGTWRARLFKRLHATRGPAVLDTGRYREDIEAGRFDVRPMFRAFEPGGVVWSDGRAEQVDAVIFATGFLPGLPFLQGLGALDGRGVPLQQRGVSTAVPGLCYVGLSYQRSFASATLRGVGPDAEAVTQHLKQHLALQAPHGERSSAPHVAFDNRSAGAQDARI
ncbi:MAG TPA: NAD(P)/FAD-dependent oxidoreductase [Rhizobacter sp.]